MDRLRLTPTAAWISLIGAALASWALTEQLGAVRFATTAVILIAALKVRLVVGHFMELRAGDLPWRRVFDIWVVAVVAIILGGYWLT